MRGMAAALSLFLWVGCSSDSDDPGGKDLGGGVDGAAGGCPANYVKVPKNTATGTSEDFCVAKYEMKIVGNDNGDQTYSASFRAESRASGTPWKNLNMKQAKAACAALGAGYHLITNEEWITLAHDIESVGQNWSDGKPHPSGATTAKLNIGQTCRAPNLCRANPSKASHAFFGEALPASSDDKEGCSGLTDFVIPKNDGKTTANLVQTGLHKYLDVFGLRMAPDKTCGKSGWHLHRRTHVLSNGAVVWDVSGNVWSWVDRTVVTHRARAAGADRLTDANWVEVNRAVATSSMPASMYKSRNTALQNGEISKGGDSTGQKAVLDKCNHIGRLHPCAEKEVNGKVDSGTIMRGGNYMHGWDNAGIYAVGMGYAPDTDHLLCQVGFRCAYTSAAK